MGIKLNEEKDIEIDVDDLQQEFRRFPSLMHAYSEIMASSSEAAEIARAVYKEKQAEKYLEYKSKEGKITVNELEAKVTTDEEVRKALRDMLTANRDYETIRGYVEGLRAKKDMLVQLGADARKE